MGTAADKGKAWDQLRQRDLQAFAPLLRSRRILQAAATAGLRVGRGPLHVVNLVWLAVGAALHPCRAFADVLLLVLKLVRDAPGGCPFDPPPHPGPAKGRGHRNDPRGGHPVEVSEEAFVPARRRLPWSFWTALVVFLAEDCQQQHAARFRWKQFRLLAVDGTTVNLQRWQRLAAYFGQVSNRRGQPRPQARLVLVQSPLTRVPYRFDVVPLKEGERTVARRLLHGLQPNDLVLLDRGFWSHGLFCQLQDQQAYFAIRLVAKVRLRRLRWLGRGDALMRSEPADWRKQWKQEGRPPSLDLRVVPYQIRGYRPSAVVTNVLDPQQVSRDDWVRLAVRDEAGRVLEPGLYHRRWEIETTFKELKVLQGMEGSLRGRTPETIRYEVAGHVLLYLLVRWLMLEAAAAAQLADPLELSFAHALGEVLDMRQTLLLASRRRVVRLLLPRLLERIAAHRVRKRPGRHYPRPRDTNPKYKGQGRYQQSSKIS